MLVLAVLGLGTQVPASAHSQLIGSDPAAGASLDRAPTTVTLTFSEEVEPQFATVTIAVAGGTPAEVQSRVQGPKVVADVPAATGEPTSGSGTIPWQVAYRVVSGDGHPITGTIDFAVASMAPVSPSPSPSISTPAESAPTTSAVGSGQEQASGRPSPSGLSIGQVLGVAVLGVGAAVAAVVLLSRRRGDRSS